MKLHHIMDDEVDFTDSNKGAEIAHASLKLMKVCSRVLWAEHRGLRMGRDLRREMGACIIDLGRKMELLKWDFGAKDVGQLHADLSGLPQRTRSEQEE